MSEASKNKDYVQMTPEEVEFLGEKNLVSIVPNFNFGVIHLISGPIGPFRAGLPVNVPIWVALNFKQQQKCRIVPQDWMNAELLKEVYDEEKNQPLFTPMPSDHYIDEAQMLFIAASDDIPDVDKIRTAVKDIWDLRMSKLRSSVISFVKDGGNYAKLDHLSTMEINSMRPLLPDALDVILTMTKQAHERSSQSADGTIS